MLSGDIKSGQRLKQNHIASLLGVSSTPVREAFRDLAAEGLVQLDARHGCMAKGLIYQDAEDIYAARSLLEPMLLKRNFAHITDSILKQCDIINEQMAATSDLDAWTKLNNKFHMKLLGSDFPSRLLDMVQQLYDYSNSFVALSLYGDKLNVERSYDEHQEILMRFTERDVDGVLNLLRRHQKMTLSLIRFKMSPLSSSD